MDQRSLTLRYNAFILSPEEEIMILSMSRQLQCCDLYLKKKKKHQSVLEEADLVDFLEFKVA